MKKVKIKKNKKVKIKIDGITIFDKKVSKNMIVECPDDGDVTEN